MKTKITFVLAGGTIDKEYDALDKAFTIGNGAVQRVLGYVNPNFDTEIISVVQKVSTRITPQDKKKIKKACESSSSESIVITYGTDAMTELGAHLHSIQNKTIVITGALKSQLLKETDAEFNVGFAVAAAQTLPFGIYIAMSGRVYPWNTCKKNVRTGQFVPIK